MTQRVHVLDFLDADQDRVVRGVCVLFGDDPFFKRLARAEIQEFVCSDDEDAFFTTVDGDQSEWRDIADELSTVSLFGGGRRLVMLENGDKFVARYRDRLESYVEKPHASSVLVLDVEKWAANTRLYKLVDKHGSAVECRFPEKSQGRRKVLDKTRLISWLCSWSEKQHQAKLNKGAAQELLDISRPEMGLLDQDLAKLALFAGPGGTITANMVHDIIGGWRAKTTWELIDAAVDGNAADALQQLDRFLHSGEHPLALLAQVSWSLRRFAHATRIYEAAEQRGERMRIQDALEQAGFPKWPSALQNAERQLKQLGRHRAGSFYRWLLEADLAMKSTHSAPHQARFVLEHLLMRLAKQVAPRRPARRTR